MTRKHYVEEYKEVIDTRAVLGVFDAVNSPADVRRKTRLKAD
ncbi:hypothetical protein [Arthrobacter sp. MMS18-M83]|nr:hypothetical protein [Arthrobacter sp. MMS18-M83]WAH99173.1 hypothetical protein OW521_10280 [Arthrobacter sp. MMS18-M83]